MATTSIGGKQYPSMQEMVGIFGGFERQRLAREDLERQKKRDKMYGDYLVNQTRIADQRAELLRAQQESLNRYRADQQMLAEIKHEFEVKKEQAATVDTAIDLVNKRLATEYANMTPGSTIQNEKFTELYGSLWQQLNAMGLSAQETGQILSSMPVLSKPEEKATIGQKVQAYLQLAEKNPDIVAGPLGEAVGLDIPPEALDTKTAKELREDIVQINKAHERGAFETEEDYLTAVRNRLQDKTAIYEDVTMAPTASDLSATAFSAVVGPEKILRKGTPSRDEAELAARHLTRNSPQGVRYKVIRDDPGPFGVGFERYKVIEDIPVGLERAWYEMSDEEKGTARALISRGVSAEKIIEAIRND